MKNKITLLLFICAAIAMMSFTLDNASTCDSPVVGGHTGAPGSPSCVYCHGGTANSGTGMLTVDFGGGATSYVPGQIYNLTVMMQQGTLDKFGFSMTARKTGNLSAGTFIVQDSINTRSYTDAGDWYFSHTPCGADAITLGSRTWNFQWQAPATNQGTITFYTAALASNHDHALSGDDTYTQSFSLDVATNVSTINIDNAVVIFPVPSRDEVNITVTDPSVQANIVTLLDAVGKEVTILRKNTTGNTFTINKKDLLLSAGIYYVQLQFNNRHVTKKIVLL